MKRLILIYYFFIFKKKEKISIPNSLFRIQILLLFFHFFSTFVKSEWLVNQHRDTLATFIGHAHLSTFTAIAENESIARTRFMLKKKMICPCGPPLPRGV
ncbi:Splicing factor 3B subunit 5 [Coelomomyces lativittatus]|nr:Splicing factor 3B subunit 5 [Coelomomyces lativittatus]